MKHLLRIPLAVVALAGVIICTTFADEIFHFENSFKGLLDSAGPTSATASSVAVGVLLVSAVWLLPISPYLCMAAHAFNFRSAKGSLLAYVYSVAVLSISTVIMLATLERRLQFMALGNIVGIALWTASLRKHADA